MTSRYLKPLQRELGRYLDPELGPMAGALFECEFEYADDLETIAQALADMPDIDWTWEAISAPSSLYGTAKGKQMTFNFYEGKRSGHYRLDVRFREMGRRWGSNEAYYLRFRAEAFALLGVKQVEHLRPTFRRKR